MKTVKSKSKNNLFAREDKLASNPAFIEEINTRRIEYKKGKTISLEDLKRRLISEV